jgi:hypothetical protein
LWVAKPIAPWPARRLTKTGCFEPAPKRATPSLSIGQGVRCALGPRVQLKLLSGARKTGLEATRRAFAPGLVAVGLSARISCVRVRAL